MSRVVVALFGPPGAGKTTIAQASGLTVYDRDDAAWTAGGEPLFRKALTRLWSEHDAQAVVIRSGATSSARRNTIHQIRATHAYLVMADPHTCHERAGHRRRHDVRTSHAAIGRWFASFDHDDGLPYWPGSWDQAVQPEPLWLPPPAPKSRPAPDRSGIAATAGRKGRPWERVCRRVYNEESRCYFCGGYVDQTLPPRTSMSRSAHHLIPPDIRPDLANVRANLRLAHYGCNSSYGRGEYETRPGRTAITQGTQIRGAPYRGSRNW